MLYANANADPAHCQMASEARVRRRWTAEEDEQLRKEAEFQRMALFEHLLGLDQLFANQNANQVMQGSLSDWNRIAATLPGRTNKDCRKRWLKVHKSLKRGAWHGEEDERLRRGIRLHGFKWTNVAKVVQTRHADRECSATETDFSRLILTPPECARRWQHSLDPSVDRSVWKAEEDEKLLVAVQKLGHNWTAIADNYMPLRSTTDIRNRYIGQSNR